MYFNAVPLPPPPPPPAVIELCDNQIKLPPPSVLKRYPLAPPPILTVALLVNCAVPVIVSYTHLTLPTNREV